MSSSFTITHLTHTLSGKKILDDVSFSTQQQEHWLITGASGSGKTTLVEMLAHYRFHEGFIHAEGKPRMAYLPQQHQFKTRSNTSDFYYQQRFQSMDAEDSATVTEYIGEEHLQQTAIRQWINAFHLDTLLERPLIQLSNGENKRVQLVKALTTEPEVLIMDNPFLGLDVQGRAILHRGLEELAEHGIQFIITGPSKEIPIFITDVLVLEQGKVLFSGKRSAYHPEKELEHSTPLPDLPEDMPALKAPFSTAVALHNVTVRYGEKYILQQLNWTVNKGEKWLLSGANGSGKSTLLSLITGDNPQAYANDILLFDRKRGSGESIWDIKKNIGYVSPELHLSFNSFSPASDVIGSGIFDTIGLFRPLSTGQEKLIRSWLRILKIEHLYEHALVRLPLGTQRLLLVIRAFIKNPPLLVLDEPCQGLDDTQRDQVLWLTDMICAQPETTLIYVSHYADEVPACITHRFQL